MVIHKDTVLETLTFKYTCPDIQMVLGLDILWVLLEGLKFQPSSGKVLKGPFHRVLHHSNHLYTGWLSIKASVLIFETWWVAL